jgi:uncharacterized protein YycO
MLKLQLPKWMLKFPGDLYCCWRPLFLSYKPKFHKIKGEEIRMILNDIKPGDILFRRYDGYLDTILMSISSFWCHAAIYVGDNNVIQAVGTGVNSEDILNFCRCDSLALYRPSVTYNQVVYAIDKAKELVKEKAQYDWKFESENSNFYCSELVDTCYNNIFKDDYDYVLGNNILTPDGLSNSNLVTCIHKFVH